MRRRLYQFCNPIYQNLTMLVPYHSFKITPSKSCNESLRIYEPNLVRSSLYIFWRWHCSPQHCSRCQSVVVETSPSGEADILYQQCYGYYTRKKVGFARRIRNFTEKSSLKTDIFIARATQVGPKAKALGLLVNSLHKLQLKVYLLESDCYHEYQKKTNENPPLFSIPSIGQMPPV